MGEVISLLLFLLAANLDTVLLAMSWSLRQRRFSKRAVLIIAAITTAATWLALVLGGWAGSLMAGPLAKKLAGPCCWPLESGSWWMDCGRRRNRLRVPATLAECGAVALALGVNNMGMGVGAGLAGLGPEAAALCNFLITIAAMALGSWLGHRAAGTWFSAGGPCLGALLIVLGAVDRGCEGTYIREAGGHRL